MDTKTEYSAGRRMFYTGEIVFVIHGVHHDKIGIVLSILRTGYDRESHLYSVHVLGTFGPPSIIWADDMVR